MKFSRLLVFFLCLPALAAFANDSFETLLATNPAEEASRAFGAGDTRHIAVPVCMLTQSSEVLPGWPTSGPTPPGMWEAIKKAKRPFDCSDLGMGTQSSGFVRLLKYAEQYNKKLLELEQVRAQ